MSGKAKSTEGRKSCPSAQKRRGHLRSEARRKQGGIAESEEGPAKVGKGHLRLRHMCCRIQTSGNDTGRSVHSALESPLRRKFFSFSHYSALYGVQIALQQVQNLEREVADAKKRSQKALEELDLAKVALREQHQDPEEGELPGETLLLKVPPLGADLCCTVRV